MRAKRNYMTKALLAIIMILGMTACSDYVSNPLEDKETGEDINLLIVDFNFFTTRMTFKLQDATDGTTIFEDAKVTFSGKNANDIVNFTGHKNPEYFTSQGQLELTTDPNIPISAASPFEFAVNVEIDGYNTFKNGFQLKSEKIETFELAIAKIADEEETEGTGDFNENDSTFQFSVLAGETLKSANGEEKPYEVTHELGYMDMLKFKDENGNLLFATEDDLWDAYNADKDNFLKTTVSTFSKYPAGIDLVWIDGEAKSVLFQKLETGKLTKLVIAGKTVGDLNGGKIKSKSTFTVGTEPDIFGFGNFAGSYWENLGKEIVQTKLRFEYTVISASTEELSGQGSAITFKSTARSSFSIDADVYDNNDKFITAIHFKGNFPESFTVSNVPSKAVKLVFRNNNPSFKNLPPLEIPDFGTGSYEVNVEATPAYGEYKIVLKALCPDNQQLAIAPSYNAEIKLKNSDHPWQGVSMEGGIVDILGLPDSEYELRLLWEEDWEYSSYATKFDAAGIYLGEPHKNSKIKSKRLEDGRIQINVEKIFDQNICEDMDW